MDVLILCDVNFRGSPGQETSRRFSFVARQMRSSYRSRTWNAACAIFVDEAAVTPQGVPWIGTPASNFASRMVTVVLTLATLGAAVSSPSTKSWKAVRSGATHLSM